MWRAGGAITKIDSSKSKYIVRTIYFFYWQNVNTTEVLSDGRSAEKCVSSPGLFRRQSIRMRCRNFSYYAYILVSHNLPPWIVAVSHYVPLWLIWRTPRPRKPFCYEHADPQYATDVSRWVVRCLLLASPACGPGSAGLGGTAARLPKKQIPFKTLTSTTYLLT